MRECVRIWWGSLVLRCNKRRTRASNRKRVVMGGFVVAKASAHARMTSKWSFRDLVQVISCPTRRINLYEVV